MAHDFWLIHPKFSDEIDPLFISDREDISELASVGVGLDRIRSPRSRIRRAVFRALEGWWEDLSGGDLNGFIVEETSRSSPDDLEFIAYPATMNRRQAETLISPR